MGKYVAAIGNPEKILNFVKKKDTTKQRSKLKKQKHQKLPKHVSQHLMKSFFQYLQPILSVFFFDIIFFAVPIVKMLLGQGVNYRKICETPPKD